MKKADFIKLVTPKLSGKYGAPMGRSNVNTIEPNDEMPKVTTRKLEMSSCGAYDIGGAYWGIGSTLYATYSKCGSIITYHRGKNYTSL